MLSETANKLPLPVHRLNGWLLANTAVVRHEQLLLRLNQSLATFLSANMCVCERESARLLLGKNAMRCEAF